MNFYKRHIGDYLKDTAHLSLLEHGVYTRLLDVYYTRESGIPDAQAARLIGARSKDELAALKVVLGEFFALIDGSWVQDRCEREIELASAQAESNRNNGKKGGRPKAKPNPQDNPNETEQKPNGLSVGSSDSASNSQPEKFFPADSSGTKEKNFSAENAKASSDKESGNPLGFISLTENNLSQTPDSRLQTKPIGGVVVSGQSTREPSDDFTPKDAGEWLRHFRTKHGFEADPTNVNDRKKLWPVFSGWVNASLTASFVDAAVASAIARSPEPISCLPLYVDRFMANAQAARASPGRYERDESRRTAAEVLTNVTMTSASQRHESPVGTVIDVDAKRIG